MKGQQDKIEQKIDQLTELMISGFDRLENTMDTRFEQVDKRFEQVDKRFDRLEGRAGRTDSSIETIKSTLAEHGKILHQLQGDVSMLVEDDLKHDKRIKRLEKIINPLAL